MHLRSYVGSRRAGLFFLIFFLLLLSMDGTICESHRIDHGEHYPYNVVYGS